VTSLIEAPPGVELRELNTLADVSALSALFDAIWGTQQPLIPGDVLRAMAKAGSYVTGAYVGGRLVGGCVGFHEEPEARALHSHIAGVLPEHVGRQIGYALKMHQRSWALARGITAIEWTYDPLIARNAYFNIVKLGARPAEYLTNFYGPMDDAINGSDDSDRILLRWEIAEPTQAPPIPDDVVRIALPTDIEALRASDPSTAREWRTRIRNELAPLMADGWRIVGFDRTDGYLLEPIQTGAAS
jgi:predicted GNAT superfamily acetyltransferase